MLRQDNVAWETEDIRSTAVERLSVEENIPDAGGAILREAGKAGVNEALSAGRVSTEERSKTNWLNGLGTEKIDKILSGVEGAREESIMAGSEAVTSSNERADTRATDQKALAVSSDLSYERPSLSEGGLTEGKQQCRRWHPSESDRPC